MNKKGQTQEAEFIPNIILTFALFAAVSGMLFYFSTTTIDVSGLQREMLASRIMYSPNALSYQDTETGRFYPGKIDFDKLTEKNIANAINFTNKRQIAARITLTDNFDNEIKNIYLSREWYNTWIRYSDAGSKEKTGLLYRKIPVTYVREDEVKNGIIHLRIITPRT